MILHKDSHTDHVSSAIVDYVLWLFSSQSGYDKFFIKTIELPMKLGTVDCGLYGPAQWDEAVSESEVHYAPRPPRTWCSRLVDRPMRTSRRVTVVAGPHEGHPCVLYTVYGGPEAPREPDDPSLMTTAELATSKAFWAHHALASP